jgi:hypothetical protein
MARQGTGVFVVNLFKLLALCGVSQMEVCRHLGLEPPVVSLWANGKRPMPRRHLEGFEQFVWDTLARKNDAYLEAMTQELGDELAKYVQFRVSDAHPHLFPEPPPDAPPVVQRWWAFHCEALRLMDAWADEASPEPLNQELGEVCREVARYGLMDDETRLGLILSGTRPALASLQELSTQLAQVLEAFTRLPPRPLVQSWRRALLPR